MINSCCTRSEIPYTWFYFKCFVWIYSSLTWLFEVLKLEVTITPWCDTHSCHRVFLVCLIKQKYWERILFSALVESSFHPSWSSDLSPRVSSQRQESWNPGALSPLADDSWDATGWNPESPSLFLHLSLGALTTHLMRRRGLVIQALVLVHFCNLERWKAFSVCTEVAVYLTKVYVFWNVFRWDSLSVGFWTVYLSVFAGSVTLLC